MIAEGQEVVVVVLCVVFANLELENSCLIMMPT